MPIQWGVLSPLATINLLKDPSIEQSTLGANWTTDVGGGTGTAVVDSTNTRWGVQSCKATKGTVYCHVYQSITTLAANYIISAYVYKDGTPVTSADFQFVIDGLVVNPDSFTPVGGGWYRAVRSQVETAAAHLTGFNVPGAATIWVDGMQFEQQSSSVGATSYCDGDQPGCTWAGSRWGSTSSRSGQSREGGQFIVFAPSSTYLDSADQTSGIGVPPLKNVYLPQGLPGGSIYQRTVKQERIINILGTANASSLDNLHLKRRQLFDLFKPDLVVPQQQPWLRYDNGGKLMWCRASYDAGLEFAGLAGTVMPVPLRFLATDPLFYEEGQASSKPAFNQSVANANDILQRDVNGNWSALGTGLNGLVNCAVVGPDGNLYVGGAFTLAGGVANTVRIAMWNGTTWVALGTGALDNQVLCLAFDAAGNLYAGGSFTQMGGVASTSRIAKWNGSTWSALGTGAADTDVDAIVVGNDGTVYAGGTFSLMGGVANTVRIAAWNGSAWSALSTGFSAGTVLAMAIGLDGSLYIGGTSTLTFSGSSATLIKWNGSAFSAVGPTGGNNVYAIAPDLSGNIYISGNFTTIGSVSASCVAKWNGSAWYPLGAGVQLLPAGTPKAFTLKVDNFGKLYVGGNFNTAGGLSLPNSLATWNGTAWTYFDATLPTSPANVRALLFSPAGTLYVGYDTSGSATTAVTTTVTNSGTAAAFPKIIITGPGTLYQIVNYTTGLSLWFNLTLMAGEVCTLDLTPGNISFVSNFRGNVLGSIIRGSNLTTFMLLPGANAISAFITGSTAATQVALLWRNTHWSVDGVQ